MLFWYKCLSYVDSSCLEVWTRYKSQRNCVVIVSYWNCHFLFLLLLNQVGFSAPVGKLCLLFGFEFKPIRIFTTKLIEAALLPIGVRARGDLEIKS